MTTDQQKQIREETPIDILRKSLNALFLELPESIATHHKDIAEKAISYALSLPALRWVKASERLPDSNYSFGESEFQSFPVRWEFEYRKILGIGYLQDGVIFNEMSSQPIDVSELEWLDESPNEQAPAQGQAVDAEGWIELDKSEPNEEGKYLCACFYNLESIGESFIQFVAKFELMRMRETGEKYIGQDGETGCFMNDSGRGCKVTHWRKLPNPPQV